MKRLVVVLLLSLCPTIAEAQVELGFDVGMTSESSGGFQRTSFHIPTKYLRVGTTGTISFESLVSVSHQRVEREHLTIIEVLPGIVYHRGPYYTRAEVGLLLVSSSFGGSNSQFAYGVAVGRKVRIGRAPMFWYVETGIDKWMANPEYLARSVFRFLVGLSVVVG